MSADLEDSDAHGPPAGARLRSVCDLPRLQALVELGLTEVSDPGMEYFARRVRALLGVPVALVSLVQAERQVFPGMSGLGQPWARKRFTPLSHSFCQHVVVTAAPLVITDAREDPRVMANPAIAELGVIGYAGFPLTDLEGQVLGSLCAIDTEPKMWTEVELDVLRDQAKACSAELRLRLTLHEAQAEHARSHQAEQALQAAYDRSQTLLTASRVLSEIKDFHNIQDKIKEFFSSLFAPSHTRLMIIKNLDAEAVVRAQHQPDTRDPRRPLDAQGQWTGLDPDTPPTIAKAARERCLLHYPDRDALDADMPEAGDHYRRQGIHTLVCAPFMGATGVLGALELGWNTPRHLDPLELAVIATTASYIAQSLDRIQLLQHRISVAHQLQNAMLAELPIVPGLQMAVRHVPADSREHVGGDWYDVVTIATADHTDNHIVVITVGDVTGHDIRAATLMGQLRSMQRQADWDHPGAPPSETLTTVDNACAALGTPITATAVHLHLHPPHDKTEHWLSLSP